jgi:hypothetical protein
MNGSASTIADRYIGKNGGPPERPRWKRPGRVAGGIVTAESVEDILRIGRLLDGFARGAPTATQRRDGSLAFEALSRLIGVSIEDLQREVRAPP